LPSAQGQCLSFSCIADNQPFSILSGHGFVAVLLDPPCGVQVVAGAQSSLFLVKVRSESGQLATAGAALQLIRGSLGRSFPPHCSFGGVLCCVALHLEDECSASLHPAAVVPRLFYRSASHRLQQLFACIILLAYAGNRNLDVAGHVSNRANPQSATAKIAHKERSLRFLLPSLNHLTRSSRFLSNTL
jgi:hypothetical protein